MINLDIGQIPEGITDETLYKEFLRIHDALQILAASIETGPESVIRSIQQVIIGVSPVTINEVDLDKAVPINANVAGHTTSGGTIIDGVNYYLSDSTTVDRQIHMNTSGQPPTTRLWVVEFL